MRSSRCFTSTTSRARSSSPSSVISPTTATASVISDEIAAYVRGDLKLPARSVGLCFDDAWRSVATVAAPLLEHYGLKAITYAIPARITEQGRRRFAVRHVERALRAPRLRRDRRAVAHRLALPDLCLVRRRGLRAAGLRRHAAAQPAAALRAACAGLRDAGRPRRAALRHAIADVGRPPRARVARGPRQVREPGRERRRGGVLFAPRLAGPARPRWPPRRRRRRSKARTTRRARSRTSSRAAGRF